MSETKEITCQRVTVKNAAKELGLDPDTLRQKMIRKEMDLGRVFPPKTKGGRHKYLIYRPKLDAEIGRLKSLGVIE